MPAFSIFWPRSVPRTKPVWLNQTGSAISHSRRVNNHAFPPQPPASYAHPAKQSVDTLQLSPVLLAGAVLRCNSDVAMSSPITRSARLDELPSGEMEFGCHLASHDLIGILDSPTADDDVPMEADPPHWGYEVASTVHHIQTQQSTAWVFDSSCAIADAHARCKNAERHLSFATKNATQRKMSQAPF